MLQQGLQGLLGGAQCVGLVGGLGHAGVAGKAATLVKPGQATQAPVPAQATVGLLHTQLGQRRLRQHARAQAVLGIVEAVPEQFATRGAFGPGRGGCPQRRLQAHQLVVRVGLPLPHLDQLAEHLRLQPGVAQAAELALAGPGATGQQRAGRGDQHGQASQPLAAMLAGQQRGHHPAGQQGQGQHRKGGVHRHQGAGRGNAGFAVSRHVADCTDGSTRACGGAQGGTVDAEAEGSGRWRARRQEAVLRSCRHGDRGCFGPMSRCRKAVGRSRLTDSSAQSMLGRRPITATMAGLACGAHRPDTP